MSDKIDRRSFLKAASATAASRAVPTAAAYVAAQASVIRLAILSRTVPLASRAWYALVDEAINISASFPKTKGALFRLFMKYQ